MSASVWGARLERLRIVARQKAAVEAMVQAIGCDKDHH
jgi:hypothetical protein